VNETRSERPGSVGNFGANRKNTRITQAIGNFPFECIGFEGSKVRGYSIDIIDRSGEIIKKGQARQGAIEQRERRVKRKESVRNVIDMRGEEERTVCAALWDAMFTVNGLGVTIFDFCT